MENNAPSDTCTFASILRQYRQTRRLGQGQVATACGFDHSYISRLEGGTRTPTSAAVGKIAEALGLEPVERERLYAAAGFMPDESIQQSLLDPTVVHLAQFFNSPSVSRKAKETMRAALPGILDAMKGHPIETDAETS